MILGRKGKRPAGRARAKHDAPAISLAFTFVSFDVRDLTIDDDEIEGWRQEKDRLVTSTIVPWKAKQKGGNYWRKLQGQSMHANAWFCECLIKQLVAVIKEDLIVKWT